MKMKIIENKVTTLLQTLIKMQIILQKALNNEKIFSYADEKNISIKIEGTIAVVRWTEDGEWRKITLFIDRRSDKSYKQHCYCYSENFIEDLKASKADYLVIMNNIGTRCHLIMLDRLGHERVYQYDSNGYPVMYEPCLMKILDEFEDENYIYFPMPEKEVILMDK